MTYDELINRKDSLEATIVHVEDSSLLDNSEFVIHVLNRELERVNRDIQSWMEGSDDANNGIVHAL